MGHSLPLFLYVRLFMPRNFSPMTGFEPRTFDIESDLSITALILY